MKCCANQIPAKYRQQHLMHWYHLRIFIDIESNKYFSLAYFVPFNTPNQYLFDNVSFWNKNFELIQPVTCLVLFLSVISFDWNGKCFKAIYIVYHNFLECLDFGCLCLSNTISQVHNTMCNINNTVIVSKYTCSVKCQYTVVNFSTNIYVLSK